MICREAAANCDIATAIVRPISAIESGSSPESSSAFCRWAASRSSLLMAFSSESGIAAPIERHCRCEHLEGHARALGDLAGAEARLAGEHALDREDGEPALGDRGAQILEPDPVVDEPLEQRQPALAVLALEALEQALALEVDRFRHAVTFSPPRAAGALHL